MLKGDVLKCLISASRARRVLEIGMFTGCAALGMAEVLPEDGKVVSCELDQYVCNLARSLMDKSPHGKKVEIRQGNPIVSTTTSRLEFFKNFFQLHTETLLYILHI